MDLRKGSGLLPQTCRESGSQPTPNVRQLNAPRKDLSSLMSNVCYNVPRGAPTMNYPGVPPFMMNFSQQPVNPFFSPGVGEGMSEPTSEEISSTCSSEYSSTSTSSSSSSSAESGGPNQPDGATLSPNYNFDFCTCDAPLPDAYKPHPPKPKKPAPIGPTAGIWCGSPSCSVAHYFPPGSKGVELKTFPIKKMKPATTVPPGACCFKNGQLIFQMPEKGRKSGEGAFPMYNVGPDETPTGVKMIKPEESPQGDSSNNTYLLTINKNDDGGKPAKLELAIKIPRPEDLSVCETDRAAQYNPVDFERHRRRSVRSRKSNGSRKSKSRSWKRASKVKGQKGRPRRPRGASRAKSFST